MTNDEQSPQHSAQRLSELQTTWLNGGKPTDEDWTVAIRSYISLRTQEKASTPRGKKKSKSTINLDTLL